MHKQRFVLRKIRNGRAKIKGIWFVPDERGKPYDGRLDGMVFAFGLYYVGDRWNDEFVYLWGPEQNYCTHNTKLWIKDAQVYEDGFLYWCWWKREVQDDNK